MDKRMDLAERADASWKDFVNRLDKLAPADWESPRGDSEWSPREVIAHVGRWEGWALERIDRHMAGDDTPLDDVDAINARWSRADAALSLDRARERATEAHQRLAERVRGLGPDDRDQVVIQVVAANTWDHYAEHIESLGI